jgi:hypothetical protein
MQYPFLIDFKQVSELVIDGAVGWKFGEVNKVGKCVG